MGWRKILSFSAGGAVNSGNWYARYNEAEDSIDLEHDSDGIPYIRDDTNFSTASGTHDYTVANGTNLEIEKYQGWDETVSVDETRLLDEAQSFDETADVSELINYIFNTTSTLVAHSSGGIFESSEIDLADVGRYNNSDILWVVDTLPAGSAVVVQSSVYDGKKWGNWAAETSGTTIGGLPVAGTDLKNGYKVKYRVVMNPDNAVATPVVSKVKITMYSKKHVRIMSDGAYKLSQHMIDSITTATTETL